MENMTDMIADDVLIALRSGEECGWINPYRIPFFECVNKSPITPEDVESASKRLARFAPVLARLFPETAAEKGIIESPLREIPDMLHKLRENGTNIKGRLFLKMDSHLPVSGSVKARGGIYEVLKHAEDLAISGGFLRNFDDDYLRLCEPECRVFFSKHKIQVGSTGNLGMSIGIMGAALGFQTIVHMSADAKAWKKELLRSRDVDVREYAGDYAEAVKNGRKESQTDPTSYFVDDENSRDLFCGYAVAGERVKKQLDSAGVKVDEDHPLFVYIPCGVGGAPGGSSFGLKLALGDCVYPFFVEPTAAPCMLLGLASGLYSGISVQDIGLDGRTEADGLAVGRPSELVSRLVSCYLTGAFTVKDSRLFEYLRTLWASEKIFIEPSACAAFQGVIKLFEGGKGRKLIQDEDLSDRMYNAVHLLWATGGSMVPDEIRHKLLQG